MGKQGVRLTQAQLPRLDRQEAGLVFSRGAVESGNRGGVIAGVKAQNGHGAGAS